MRIQKTITRVTLIAALSGVAGYAMAQAPNQTFTVHKVKDNIYFVQGDGGNSGVIIGENGVIVVDAKTTLPGGKAVVDEVAKLTNKPITTVILTHSDADHVNGLPSFPKGITIIAHANDKKEMEQAIASGARNAPSKDYLPNKVVTGARENDTIDGVKLTLIHVANAHTSGDLAVYLPDEKLAFTGDLIGNGDPLIHAQKNGNSEGWVRFVTALTQLDADTYVLGHADPETKAQVEEHLKAAEAKREKIAALVKEGKSLDQVRQALGEKTPATPPRFPPFTETTYDELTKK